MKFLTIGPVMTTSDFYKLINKKYNFSPSHFELIKHFFIDGLIFGTIYFCLNTEQIPFYLIAQILWTVFFFRFFGLMHDGVHSNISRNFRWNNMIGYISGAFCFLPYYPWKKMHLQHHYWAGNVEQDPVMRIIREYDPKKKFKNKILGFAWKSWIPLLAFMQHAVFWIAGLSFVMKAKTWNARISWAFSYIIPGLIYYQLYKINMFTFYNVAPGIICYLIMVEIVNFPHHLELPQNYGEKKLPVWEQYQISRSCSYPNWFASLILNNFNYHTEHHMFPKAPWYMLRKLHTEVSLVLGEAYNYCNSNEWVIRNRKKGIEELLVYKAEFEIPLSEEKKKIA